ncbi:MAG: hypothetical protein R6X33_04365 [Candidatus Brocadiia bacterium]
MTERLDRETRVKAEQLIRDVADEAQQALVTDGDAEFFEGSERFAAGIARGVLLFGYSDDYDELLALVDEFFRR